MDIYVVQPGDTIFTIAEKYGVSATKLIQDNELDSQYELVSGQTIVITYPAQTYTVQEGDTLQGIADAHGVPLMQILRNNPFLADRKNIFPGEILTISYKTNGKIATNGFVYPYIKDNILRKTLPFLTYLTVYNYKSVSGGEIEAYYDDSKIIKTAKEYGVILLVMASTTSPQGVTDIQMTFDILLNSEYQDHLIDNILKLIKSKGYDGINIALNFMNISNQKLYQDFVTKMTDRIGGEGYLVFVTINLDITIVNNEVTFEKVDYSGIAQAAKGMIFLQFVWGTNFGPPSPVTSINNLKEFINYAVTMVAPEKLIMGTPVTSYDWELPYVPGRSYAISMTISSFINLARDVGAIIQFDDISQTPYFLYEKTGNESVKQHIVWSIDARTIEGLRNLICENKLNGTAIWNIMTYVPQLWLVMNSQCEIERYAP